MLSLKPLEDDSTNAVQRYPIRRLEPSLQKFLKVLEIDLARLHQHRVNIDKFNQLDDWYHLHREQVNASRTVQQIKANVKEIEKARNQIIEEDLSKFDESIESIKQQSLLAVMEYLQNNIEGEPVTPDISNSYKKINEDRTWSVDEFVPQPSQSYNEITTQLHFPNIPQDTQAAESWENLKEGLVELNSLIHDFSSVVESQQETVDRIEDNIESAHENVQSGIKSLSKGAKYKAAVFPVAGAFIGGVVAGPIGFVAGAKIGGLAGLLGGSFLGFIGGKILKKNQQKAINMELNSLSKRGAQSLPDLSTPLMNEDSSSRS